MPGSVDEAGYTYADLESFPEDNFRRELIGGELIVTASPNRRHQDVVLKLGARLLAHTETHSGKVFVAPFDVYLSDIDVVEPDVLFVGALEVDQVETRFVRGAPALVVEVSSPSTRRLELVRKHELYRSFSVSEYWYIDLDLDQVQVYRLEDDYRIARIYRRTDTLETAAVPGFSVPVDYLLGPVEEGEGAGLQS